MTTPAKLIQLTLEKDDAAILSYLLGTGIAFEAHDDDTASVALSTIVSMPGFVDRAQAMLKKLINMSKAAWTREERAIVAANFIGIISGCLDGDHCHCNAKTCCICGKPKPS